MKKTLICLTVLFTFFTTYLNAQVNDSEEYIVEKFDTLWDISETRLDDPFLWPKLWNVNPHIENPDLIYPGSRIRIPSREELMRTAPHPDSGKIRPFARKRIPTKQKYVKPEQKSKYIIPEIEKKTHIVDRSSYIASGWISDDFPSAGKIMFSPFDRQIVGENDIVYIKPDEGAADEKRFFAIKDVKVVKHPTTGKKIGHQVRVAGILEVIGMEGNMTKAKIVTSFEDIQMGDGILPYQELEPPLIPDTARTPSMDGYIIASHKETNILGEGEIVFLDKGENDGLEVGDVFSVLFSDIFSGNRTSQPPERIVGKIQIVSLQPKTSGAVVLDAFGEVTIGTRWGQK